MTPVERARGHETRRLWALAGGLGLMVGFLLLGLEAREGHMFAWDRAVWRFLHGHELHAQGSVFDRVANSMLDSGGTAAMVILGIALVAILLRSGRTQDALFVVTAGTATLALTPLLKEPFERAELKYSFPSGHSAASSALVAAAVIVAWPTRLRWVALVFGTLFAATLGTVLVYENWHLPSDVLGGWCVGVGCAVVARGVTAALARGRRRLS